MRDDEIERASNGDRDLAAYRALATAVLRTAFNEARRALRAPDRVRARRFLASPDSEIWWRWLNADRDAAHAALEARGWLNRDDA